MARISVKYPIGAKVVIQDAVPSMVTAIFIRGKNTAYEASYLDGDTPTSVTVEECELSKREPENGIGYK